MKDKKTPENATHYLPIFMCIGLSVGLAIGAGVDNIPIGMCIGMGIGVALGSALDSLNRKDEEQKNEEDKDTEE